MLSNRLAAAKSIVDRASQLIHITPRESERLSEAQRELVCKDYHAVSKQLERLADELSDREAVLRMKRLDLSLAYLESPELSRERLLAAYYWRVDIERIKAFLETARRRPGKDVHFPLGDLNDPHWRQQLLQKGKQAERLAGDLSAKAPGCLTGCSGGIAAATAPGRRYSVWPRAKRRHSRPRAIRPLHAAGKAAAAD